MDNRRKKDFRIVKEYKLYNCTNIYSLADNLGFTVENLDLQSIPEIKFSSKSYKGILDVKNDNKKIQLDLFHDEKERNYITAYLLSDYLLNCKGEQFHTFLLDNEIEIMEIYNCAKELIIPNKVFKSRVEENYSFEKIGDVYNIPPRILKDKIKKYRKER